MPQNDYKLNVKATGVNATKKAMKGLGGAVKGMMTTLAPLVGVVATFQAIKKSVSIASDIKPVELAFKNMTKAAGLSSKSLNTLQTATNGTMTSFDMMKQANNAMMLGIVDNEEQMGKMFDTAQRLAAAVGQDATFGVESLVTGLGRQSKLMLDNLGIMVDTEGAYEDYADSLGKTASELTDAEKKQAFINAALTAADGILADIGDEQLTYKDKVNQLKVTLEDMGRSVGDVVIPILSDAIDIFYDIKKSLGGAIETAQNVDWSATWGNFLDALPDVIQTYRMIWADIFDYIVDLLPGFWQKFKDGVVATTKFMWEAFKNLAGFWIDPLVASFGIFVFKTKKKFQVMWADMKQLVMDSLEWIVDKFNMVMPSALEIDLDFGEVDRSKIAETETMIKSFQDSLKGTDFMEMVMGVTDDTISNADELLESIKSRIEELKDQLVVLKEDAPPLPGTNPEQNEEDAGNLDIAVAKQKSATQQIKEYWESLTDAQKQDIKQTAKDFVTNTTMMGEAGIMGKKEAKMIAKAQNVMDTYASATAAFKAMAGIPIVGPALGAAAAAAAIGAGIARGKEIEKAQYGFSGMVNSPTTFLAGEAGAEMVNVTPLEGPNLDGPQGGGITVNVSGNVMSQEFAEEELPSLIQEALRKGVDFSIA